MNRLNNVVCMVSWDLNYIYVSAISQVVSVSDDSV